MFRALADTSRRTLLDRLFERDGQTLGELEAALPDMTRFGVMKHLRVLEAAGLVTSRKVGRERHHYLNPIPIRRIHDRWLDRFRIRAADLLDELKSALEAPMTTETTDAATAAPPRFVHTTFIRATPERIWQALTDSSFTARYYYHSTVHSDWAVGSAYEYRIGERRAIEGEILEADRPRRLSMSFHALWNDAVRADAPSTMSFEIEDAGNGVSKLTVIHEDMGPATSTEVVGGWPLIAAGLKTLLETGEELMAAG